MAVPAAAVAVVVPAERPKAAAAGAVGAEGTEDGQAEDGP